METREMPSPRLAEYSLQLADDNACEQEARRQQMFYSSALSVRSSLNSSHESLPVVELKPFTKKQWWREKSLPNFYTRHGRSSSNSVETQPENEQGKQEVSYCVINPAFSSASSRRPINVVDMNAFTSFKSYKSNHPEAKIWRDADDQQPYHHVCRPQTFVTKLERHKSTVQDIEGDASLNKGFSCVKQALSASDICKIQDIRLHGEKMNNGRRQNMFDYLNPFSVYKSADKMPFCGRVGGRIHGSSERKKAWTSRKEDTPVSLPSIEIRYNMMGGGAGGMRARQSKGHRSVAPPVQGGEHNIYRLGGVRNAFHIMEENGKPVVVEKHLSTEFESTLEKVRRNPDLSVNAAVVGSPRNFNQAQVVYRGGPTIGEKIIKRSFDAQNGTTVKPQDSSGVNHGPSSLHRTEAGDSGIESPVDDEEPAVTNNQTQFTNKLSNSTISRGTGELCLSGTTIGTTLPVSRDVENAGVRGRKSDDDKPSDMPNSSVEKDVLEVGSVANGDEDEQPAHVDKDGVTETSSSSVSDRQVDMGSDVMAVE